MKKLLFTLLGSGFLCAEPQNNLYENNFIVDPYLSPYVGADDLLIAHKLMQHSSLQRLTDLYQTNPATWAKYSRAAELILFWEPFNYMSMVVQHEVFGHGYRVRSIPGTAINKYTFNVPPPYGPGGAATQFYQSLEHTTAFERLAIDTGGVEATAIYANRLRMQWLKKGQINPRQSSLYYFAQHDLTRYAIFSTGSPGDDMNNYRKLLNHTYAGSKLTRESLLKQSLINLLDPFTYYSAYSAWNFIGNGTNGPIPMIPIGSYRYLPGARLGLTPFGPEYYLENFLVKDNKPIYFYLRGGKHVGMNYMGLGIENPHQWDLGSFQIGYRADLWHQPDIDMQDRRFALSHFEQMGNLNANTAESRFGASVSLIAQKKLWETGMLFVQCGGKTQGYVPGESLNSSLILRVGITLW
jgi:hypothetical protein